MNIKNLFKFVLVWVSLLGVLPAMAAFKDVKVDLNSLLTSEEMVQGTAVSFGGRAQLPKHNFAYYRPQTVPPHHRYTK